MRGWAASARKPLRGSALGLVTGSLVGGMVVDEALRGYAPARRDAWVRAWAGGVLRALAVEVVTAPDSWSPEGTDAPAGGRLVVSDHRSIVDIPVLLARFGGALLAKAEMQRWPVAGWVATRAGTLYVDRANPTAGAAAIRTVTESLDARRTVGVFPEGTTFKGDAVRPFQPGAFVAIHRTGGEVVPVGLAYEDPAAEYFDEPFGAHAARLLTARRTRVGVAVGRPFAVGEQGIRALAARSRDEVEALVRRARAAL